MQPNKHIVIFSHGFGVRKDDLGLLSDIAEKIPEVRSILFDYFDIDEENKTLTVCNISVQAKKLNEVIMLAREENPDAVIDIIAHSQGAVVAGVAKPDGIRKTIFIASPFDMSLEHTLKRHRANPYSHIDLEGISKLRPLPQEGLTRLVPSEYWAERATIKPFDDYNTFSSMTELIVIIADQDTVVPAVDLSELNSNIKIMHLDGDHSFNGPARAGLIKAIRNLIL